MAASCALPILPTVVSLAGKLSLMWGDYKDKVDELTMEMNKNASNMQATLLS